MKVKDGQNLSTRSTYALPFRALEHSFTGFTTTLDRCRVTNEELLLVGDFSTHCEKHRVYTINYIYYRLNINLAFRTAYSYIIS